jgi:dihydrolipoamide dehydrogenase
MAKQFDVIVIGGGPGGYIAAIRAAQLGFNTACIDEWKNERAARRLGGTCTNVGCIPSKALLQSSEHYEEAGKHFADHGINVKACRWTSARCWRRKDTVVKQNNDGILYLFKKNKVTFFHGRGSFAKAAEGGYETQGRRLHRGHARRPSTSSWPRAPTARAAGRALRRGEHPLERRRAARRRRCRRRWR